ncbi:MAG: Na/Pi symporter [Deferrisomatales bacterium]|nr:Na/Pi symporter [Deferrisomatales bacterium]
MLRRIVIPVVFAVLAWGFWVSPDFKQIAAGVAIFLCGMLSLEEGFRSFTGGALEQLLQRTTDRLWKSLLFGVVTTTIMQSSSLVSVITISFLSAGLLELVQGIGILFGANLGTTTVAWLVAGLGLRVDMAAYAMPLLVFGVILMFQKGRSAKGLGHICAGLGFLLLGIHHMKEGFEAFKAGVELTRFAVSGFPGVVLYTAIGVVATVVMQSSHATLVLIITALAAGQVTYPNALALAIGSNLGTTVTAVLGSLSANEQGKRLAAAHCLFNGVTAVLAVAGVRQFVWLVDRISGGLGIAADDYTLKLALFHTLFNLMGLVVMVPLTGRLVAWLERLIPRPVLLAAQPRYLNAAAVDFPATAVEAVRNEVIHLYENALGLICRTLGLSPDEVFSDKPLGPLAQGRGWGAVPPYPIDEAYQGEIKALFSHIIAFISRATFTWEAGQSARLHWLRNAGAELVEAVKGVKHLQKNLVRYTASTNPAQRAEYQNIRRQMAEALRDLEHTRHTEEGDMLLMAFDHLRLEVEQVEHGLLDRVYGLINGQSISPEAGTSLINDYGYACDVLRHLIQAASTLFPDTRDELHSAQRAVRLDDEELHQVLLESADGADAEEG